jgi:hypothetical protein
MFGSIATMVFVRADCDFRNYCFGPRNVEHIIESGTLRLRSSKWELQLASRQVVAGDEIVRQERP